MGTGGGAGAGNSSPRPRLLRPLLDAVLQPKVPIQSLCVINPEVTLDNVAQHGAILDVRVQLADGRQVDVEKQSARHTGLRERFLFYWARAFSEQLRAGGDYGSLMPVVGVFILGFSELPGRRLHSTYALREATRRDPLTDALELHFLELPKLAHELRSKQRAGEAARALLNWCRFLAAESDEELEKLAMTDSDMRQAKAALDELSADPTARRLAEERRLAEWNDRYVRGREREAGRAEGLEAGRAALAEALLKLLRRRFGELPVEVERRLRGADQAALARYTERVLEAASLSELFGE